ncbi:MAG: hypothetical protein ACLP7A_01545 [Desulfobaccales bacterium]
METVTYFLSPFVTAISTAVIAFFTWALVRANRQLWKASQEHSIHSQRAYIFIKEIIHNIKPREGIGELIIVLENTGETPARKMICNYDFCCFSGDIPNGFDFPNKLPPVYGVISRKATIDAKVLMPFNVFDDALTKRQRLYIYGWVDYDDVFPNTPRYRTESCYEVLINKDREFSYHIYGNYNGTDDECYRKPSPYVSPV